LTDAKESGAGWASYALVAPALVVIAAFFVFPLLLSAVLAFRAKGGGLTFEHFAKAWDLYQTDLLFTVAIVLLSTVLIGIVAIAIAGYLTLGENPRAVIPPILQHRLWLLPAKIRMHGDQHRLDDVRRIEARLVILLVGLVLVLEDVRLDHFDELFGCGHLALPLE